MKLAVQIAQKFETGLLLRQQRLIRLTSRYRVHRKRLHSLPLRLTFLLWLLMQQRILQLRVVEVHVLRHDLLTRLNRRRRPMPLLDVFVHVFLRDLAVLEFD